MKLEFFVKLWHIHEIIASFFCFTFISQTFEQILKYFAQSQDCMIAAFRNSAGAVLQTAPLLINWLSNSAFSLKHHNTQTVRHQKLKFLEDVHPHNVSHVRCSVSLVICHVSNFFFIAQSSLACRWMVCNQQWPTPSSFKEKKKKQF